jgi:hypothetical protein
VGAFGETFDDCRERFGELLAVSGAVVYQPADGTNVPDYLIASDSQAPAPQMLWRSRVRRSVLGARAIQATNDTGAIGLADLAESCLETSGARPRRAW